MVVHMPCDQLRVNIQDAAGDRILAGELLKRDDTNWLLWMEKRNYEISDGAHEYQTLSHEETDRLAEQEADAHVGHVLGEVRHNPRRKFPKGPRMRRGVVPDACRIYGSLEGNKVQGDFQITARGHGYRENAPHLDHSCMCSLPPKSFSSRTRSLTAPSLQLLPHDHGALLRTALPNPAEPT